MWPVTWAKGKKLDGRLVVHKKFHDGISYLLAARLVFEDNEIIIVTVFWVDQGMGEAEVAEIAESADR